MNPAGANNHSIPQGRPKRGPLPSMLKAYAQVLFSDSPAVGAILCVATFASPWVGAHGMLALLVSLAAGRIFGMSGTGLDSGALTFNAIFVGLGIGAMAEPGLASFGLVIPASIAALLLSAMLSLWLGSGHNLPSLTLPFLGIFYLVLALIPNLRSLDIMAPTYDAWLSGEWLPHSVAFVLKSLGAIFFLPRVDVGILVALALLIASRISFVLALLGALVAYPIALYVAQAPTTPLLSAMGFNVMLVAIGAGGIWFVPHRAGLLFAALASIVGAFITLGLFYFLEGYSIPVLILPFNITMLVLLQAMRSREKNSFPTAVEALPSSPELNLARSYSASVRFPDSLELRLQLPFMGRWTCTQGNDGEHTHKELWRHGLDFEVLGPEGSAFRNSGLSLEDYYCYRLPVTAAAEGTVALVVDGIEDNRPGEANQEQNWGNVVVVAHGPRLYSLYAHMARGSIKVRRGETVRRGATLGLCGSSGRSFVPHLHFQLQGTPEVGAPTLPLHFHDVIQVHDDHERYLARLLPNKGDVVRCPERDSALVSSLTFATEEPLSFRCSYQGKSLVEHVHSVLDLYGGLTLFSDFANASLPYENRTNAFVTWNPHGPTPSVVHLLAVALPRLPFESAAELRWSEQLFSPLLKSPVAAFFSDFIAPITGPQGLQVEYRITAATDNRVSVQGRSSKTLDGVTPVLQTELVLEPGKGIRSVSVIVNNRRFECVNQDLASQTTQTRKGA